MFPTVCLECIVLILWNILVAKIY